MNLRFNKEIKIGILVIVTILFFIVGYSFLKGRNLFKPTNNYYVVYDQIGGLTESSHVFLSGFRVGYVDEITFMDDMQHLLVRIAIERGVTLSVGTTAKIFSSDIMGSRAVELIQGAYAEKHSSGDTLLADYSPDLTDQVKNIIQPLTIRANQMMSSMDSVLLVFQAMFDQDFQTNFAGIVRNISNTVNSLDTLLTAEDSRVNRILSNLGSVSENLAESNEDIGTILNNFAAISDSLSQAELLATMNHLNEVLSDANQMMISLRQGEGSLGKLMTDEELYNNLESVSRNLDLLLIDIKERPGRFVNFSIFGRRQDRD
jgi:phospholipid/cholesterol/gamma-HCH transport system substrate-binding protein